jgi:5-methylcytosine-specific restriction protein A
VHGYRDGWEENDENGVFLYTGEGQVGDMEFVRGNVAIRDHAIDGKDLHLFETRGKGDGCRYLGLFECIGWNHRRGPDSEGNERSIIVFQLLRSDKVENSALAPPLTQESRASLEELRQRAWNAFRHVGVGEQSPRDARRNYYERSQAVKAYVLGRAAGTCEACRKRAPFFRVDGTPYLEPHHLKRVADAGLDNPLWVGGVCPNCHREVHCGQNGPEVNRRLEAYIRSIEPGEPRSR